MLPFEACGIALMSKGLPYWGFYLTSWKIAFVPMVTFFFLCFGAFFPYGFMVALEVFLLWYFIPSRLGMAVLFTFCYYEIF